MKDQIIIKRQDLFTEIGSVCYLIASDPSLDAALRTRIADVLDPGSIEVVSRAIDRAFTHIIHYMTTHLSVEREENVTDLLNETLYRFSFDPCGAWSPLTTERLERDIFSYLLHTALYAWFMLVYPQRAALHKEERAAAKRSITELISGSGRRARIVPHPF